MSPSTYVASDNKLDRKAGRALSHAGLSAATRQHIIDHPKVAMLAARLIEVALDALPTDDDTDPRNPPLKELLSSRAYQALRRGGIESLNDLANCTERGLRDIYGIGDAAVAEIQEVLTRYGRRLRPPLR